MGEQARVLVTGASGYIGGRLVPALLERGLLVRVLARNPAKLAGVEWSANVELVAGDALDGEAVGRSLAGVHTAYYLLHSLVLGDDFGATEARMARIFAEQAVAHGVAQIVYLGGIANDADLSEHLASRAQVGRELRSTGVPVLELRAGMVLGSGSASFEMLRYLTEHLPVMITPKWARNHTQPIAVRDVLHYLTAAAERPEPVDAICDIGGPETVSYSEMMQRYAQVAGLSRRFIIPVPFLTTRLSSLWVGLVTPVPASIARPLVDSLRNEVVVSAEHDVHRVLPPPPAGLLPFDAAVALALQRIVRGGVPTRWSDATGRWSPSAPAATDPSWSGGTEYRDERHTIVDAPASQVWPLLESIGGDNGWFGFDWAWRVRGAVDRLFGGVGLRRGRRDPRFLRVGDGLDFWRVEALERGRLLRLRAEMKLPGTALLEFHVREEGGRTHIDQKAIFVPRGLFGRAYWLALLPVHAALFPRMLAKIASAAEHADPGPG
jgi:uncharacterized protein YbjT (DUF2867 family)